MPSLIRSTALALLFVAVPAASQAAPAMWEVSDADSKVWLFGSMHALPPDLSWRTPLFDDTLKAADQVYFEADIGPLGTLGILLKSLKSGFSGQSPPWLTTLSPGDSAKLAAAIKPLGLTPDQLGAYQPWLAEGVVEDKVMNQTGFTASAGVDSTLQGELPKERKAYFETAGGQMDMLAADPEAVQVRRLLASVGDIANMSGELKDMATAWSTGDTTKLTASITDDPTLDPDFTKTMLFDRNARWVTAIEGLLAANHQDLIIVGAAHLVGDGSVTDLLAKAGFTVKRIQ